ncbi:MAG TPA: hypothetical protein VE032_07380 [Actinomycetota bacterium]|nr:hypothetical protein [Actinomycetota bacterium]
MNVDAFLADAVQASGGKLHALGIGWSVLRVSGFPARHDRIGIGVTVRSAAAEAGPHTLTISLLDPAGAPRPLGTEGSLRAGFATPAGDGTATLALNLDGLTFETGGEHTFVLTVDEDATTRLSFHVQAASEAPTSEIRTVGYL